VDGDRRSGDDATASGDVGQDAPVVTFRKRPSVDLADPERSVLRALVGRPLFELIPLRDALDRAEALPSGARTTVTASPSHGIESTIELCEGLVAAGHDATPHLAAHMISDRSHLAELLDRCRSGGIRGAFVVGGDAKDRGEIHDGLTLIRLMEELDHPFDAIGVPAYPEGHPSIPDEVLVRTLRDKQPHAAYMTTQMSFNPAAISAWVARTREAGVTLPIHVGVPGAATMRKLATIGARIGVTGSVRYLRKHRNLLGHLVGRSFGPDALLEAIAPTLAEPSANVRGLHIFTFNQVDATVDWQKRMLAELS
jgi:methylenetetrahydrofolate reductase (NADPH)